MDNPRLFLWIGLALLALDERHPVEPRLRRAAPRRPRHDGTPRSAAARRPRRRAPSGQLPALPTAPAPAGGDCRPLRRGTGAAAATAVGAAGAADRARRHRRARHGHQPAGRRRAARRPAEVPAGQEKGSPPVRLLTTDDATYQCRAQRPARGATAAPNPTHLAMFTRAAQRIPARARRAGTARAAHVDRRPGRHRHQDLCLQAAASTRSMWYTTCRTRRRRTGRRPPTCSSCGTCMRRSARCSTSRAMRSAARPSTTARSTRSSTSTTRTTRSSPQAFAGGWMAEMQHHFVTAAVPPAGETYDFTLRREGKHSAARLPRPAQDRARRAAPAVQREAVRRPEAAGAARRPSSPKLELHRRLRQAHDPRAAAVLAAASRCTSSSATGAGRSSSSRSC